MELRRVFPSLGLKLQHRVFLKFWEGNSRPYQRNEARCALHHFGDFHGPPLVWFNFGLRMIFAQITLRYLEFRSDVSGNVPTRLFTLKIFKIHMPKPSVGSALKTSSCASRWIGWTRRKSATRVRSEHQEDYRLYIH
jgi:hypothetical protein